MNGPELYSEQDVLSKVIVPHLAVLGYDEKKRSTNKVVLRFNHPIKVQQGREKKTIFADLVVFVNEVPVIVVDAKNPRAFLTENDREQAVSYARLLPNIAPYAALCNGTWQVFDSIRKQQIRALPTLRDLLRDLQRRRLTASERQGLIYQATRTLFAIDSARELSRLMRRCHDIIRNLKGYDPTKAFDELSKILFAKMYEEREIDEGRRKDNRFTIEAVREMRKQGVEIIQTLWKDTITSPRYREVFSDESPDSSIELPSEAIDRIVEILQGKSLGLTDLDVKGVAFEEFLSATYRGGELGQYFTTREVVNFMVDLVEPRIGERIIDPSCGSGGFLIRAYDVVRDKILLSDLSEHEKSERLKALATRSLVGIDWETRAARTCKMNMIIHGDGHAGVYQANALDLSEVETKVKERQRYYPSAPAIDEGTFDVVLTNPPFGAKDESPHILKPYDLGKGKSQKREVLLLERQIRLLRPGGRLAVVIPEGILSNKNDQHIRQYILSECIVKAVIRLPQDAFKMSEGAACTSVLYAVKRNPDDPALNKQGDIFFARAEFIGVSPAGRPIAQNDLLTIRERFRAFAEGQWDGIKLKPAEGSDRMTVSTSDAAQGTEPWVEPMVNRTSVLYDRLCYVLRSPGSIDRFSYTYNHPEYYRLMATLDGMPVETVQLRTLCVDGYPARGKKPSEESDEGIPVLKVRNVTGVGIDLETEFAPDMENTRTQAGRAMLQKGDILITSTGEGTIGRVEIYPYDEPAIADGHVTICRLKEGSNLKYVAEFLRSEIGQIQMLRHVSGSTGQTELLVDHIRSLRVPVPSPDVQAEIVRRMEDARKRGKELGDKARELREQGVGIIAMARQEMTSLLQHQPGLPERSARGPGAQTLALKGDLRDLIGRALAKKPPAGGWPKLTKANKPRKKPRGS
jgi:type I restriction enzyme M protein